MKKEKKVERYQKLKTEIKKMWNIRSIKVIPVALGSTSKKLKFLINTPILPKTALQWTDHLLRKVLDGG